MAKRLHVLLIPFAAFLATLPLFLHGPSCGHDFAFHLLSWQDAALQFAHGTLRPRWAFLPAWGAGEPRFLFYPPLSWTLGGLLTLASAHLPGIAPDRAFAFVPAFFTWFSLSAAGLGMVHLARRYTSAATATLAGTVYLANPYTLFTAYERTAYAELLAAAWLPLLFAAILPPSSDDPQSPNPLSIPATAIALALLWLTNAPAAVLGSYAIALVIGLRLLLLLLLPSGVPRYNARTAALHLLLRALAATALGLSLAAFYIVPAALDRKWVSIDLSNAPGLRPQDNTLFHHTGDTFHDQVLHTASVLALTLLFTIALTLLIRAFSARGPGRRHTAALSPLPLCLIGLAAASLFLLTPWSLALWQYLPELAFVQFPWRLCALLAPLAALSLALLVAGRTPPVLLAAIASLLSVLTLALPAASTFRIACDDEDLPQATAHLTAALLLHKPISNLADEPPDGPTDEYTPRTADNEDLARNNPPLRTLPADIPDDTPPPADAIPAPAPLRFDLSLRTPTKVVLNLRNFPLWSVRNNGHPVTDFVARNDGLLAFILPAGVAHLSLDLRHTRTETLSTALSLLALLILAAIPILRKRALLLREI